MAKMHNLTIDDLYRLCKEKREQGQGNKKILISDDVEGNGFHNLFYSFSPTKVPESPQDFFGVAGINRPDGVTDENINDYILLG